MRQNSLDTPKRIILCSLLLSAFAHAVDATGVLRYEECGLMTANHLHLDQFRHHDLHKTVLLKLPGPLEEAPKDWFDVPGMECIGPQQCIPAAKAKIQLLRVSHRWWGRWIKRTVVSGNYAVEFKDGTKLEGSFKAKVRNPTQKIICE